MVYYQEILISIIVVSLLFKGTHRRINQAMAFILLLVTFWLKEYSAFEISHYFPLKSGDEWISANIDINFILSNSARIFQHLIITCVLYFFIYKDRRCFIPILINTLILVLYCLSNIAILFGDSFYIQRIIFSSREILAFVIFLSLVDYGDNVYDRLYNNKLFTSGKYISRLYSVIALREFEEKAEKESVLI